MWDRDGNARLGGIAGCKIEEAYVGPSKMRSSDSLSVPLDFVSESQNLKIYKETTLLLFSQVFVFVFERISALQSQVSSFNYLLGFAVRKFQHIKMC